MKKNTNLSAKKDQSWVRGSFFSPCLLDQNPKTISMTSRRSTVEREERVRRERGERAKREGEERETGA